MDVLTSPTAVDDKSTSRRPANRFAHGWTLEVIGFLALIGLYTAVRSLVVGSPATAYEHARQILAAEGSLFQLVELPLNRWMTGVPVIAVAACYFYALMHYALTPLVLVLSRRRGGWLYQRGFWTLVLASGIAVVIYAAYPVAPPRLVPDLGVVDIMRSFASYGWWGDAASAPRGIGDATNQFAAMPSMHFGWALWCAMQMWGFGHRAWRVVAVVYPSVLAVVVVATANHFVLDLVGGALCVLVAYGIVTAVAALARDDHTEPVTAI